MHHHRLAVTGSLTVVGTGIQPALHLTAEARVEIERAELLLHLVPDPLTRSWIAGLNRRSRSLHTLYRLGKERNTIYAEIVDELLTPVRGGVSVCAAFYGHPGVFVDPSHEAVRRARAEGYEARMLPAVSAADCLVADLGVDPGRTGCQTYDATDFLVNRRQVDPTAALILFELSVVGVTDHRTSPTRKWLPVLLERLREDYPADHSVVVYEASPFPVAGPIVRRIRLDELDGLEPPALSTLYIPPVRAPTPDGELLRRLGLPPRR